MDSCDEVNNICVNTPNDNNCPDDGLFCNGTEICDANLDCISTGDPCSAGVTCNEDMDTCEDDTGKVVICHIPHGQPKKSRTLSVGAAAVPSHLAHGDFLGECPQ